MMRAITIETNKFIVNDRPTNRSARTRGVRERSGLIRISNETSVYVFAKRNVRNAWLRRSIASNINCLRMFLRDASARKSFSLSHRFTKRYLYILYFFYSYNFGILYTYSMKNRFNSCYNFFFVTRN